MDSLQVITQEGPVMGQRVLLVDALDILSPDPITTVASPANSFTLIPIKAPPSIQEGRTCLEHGRGRTSSYSFPHLHGFLVQVLWVGCPCYRWAAVV